MTIKQKVLREIDSIPDDLLEEAYKLLTSLKKQKKSKKKLPIVPAKTKSDFKALAGIWEGRDINIEKLRKAAWGGRV